MAVIHRRGETSASSPSLAAGEDSKKGEATMGTLYRIGGGLLGVLGLFMLVSSSSGIREESTAVKKQPPPMSNYPDWSWAFVKYEFCEVSYKPPPPKKEWDTKPLWLTAFPGSGTTGPTGKGDILKPLINGITGLKGGAKFYHASSKVQKRCKGLEEAATCAQGHPVVEVGPERQAANFYRKTIMVIRNYRTAFPTSHCDKDEAYHGGTGQVEENKWRATRDDWYHKVFEEWKRVITTWKNMKEYDIGAYVMYEELMDPDRGPAACERMANLLEEAGFSVAPKEDLPCIWFKAVKDEYLRLQEYWKYTSGYTAEQRDGILQELDKFQEEVADDKELVAILKEYHDDIRDNTYIDVPSQKDRGADATRVADT